MSPSDIPPMSTYLIGRKGIDPAALAVRAIEDAGRACPYCDADYSLAHDPDAPAVVRLRIAHDRQCPMIRDRPAANRAQRRAGKRGRL